VNGQSAETSAAGGSIGPGEWPMRKNRASLRLSASNALTGNVA
jgi:hypothetical protein